MTKLQKQDEMKKLYVEPVVELIDIPEDVICTSDPNLCYDESLCYTDED